MASPKSAVTFDGLKSLLDKREFAPVYLLHGEEGYFIDELVKRFEAILPVEERDFNLYTMYAPQVSADNVMDACRRYPMMSEYQVVIVKEVQSVKTADYLNRLSLYLQQPSTQTILVVCCRGKSAESKSFFAEIKKCNGVVFESNRIKEKEMSGAIASLINSKGLKVDQKSLSMLRDYVGSDLSRMYNEIEKLALVLEKGAMVTPEDIERNIGISKDYNNFELINALVRKDARRVYQIVDYFKANPKNNPTVQTTTILFNFFSNLLVAHFSKDKSENALMAALGLKWPFQLNEYRTAMQYYNAYKTIEIISAIRNFDAACKGIGSRQDERDLMRDLMFRILTAAGDIAI